MLLANERRGRVGGQRTVVSNVCECDEEVSHSTRGVQPLLPSSSLEGERGGKLGVSSPPEESGGRRKFHSITETGGALTRVEEVAGALLRLACDRCEDPAHVRMSCVCASRPVRSVVAGEARKGQQADFWRGEVMSMRQACAVCRLAGLPLAVLVTSIFQLVSVVAELKRGCSVCASSQEGSGRSVCGPTLSSLLCDPPKAAVRIGGPR